MHNLSDFYTSLAVTGIELLSQLVPFVRVGHVCQSVSSGEAGNLA